MTENFFNGVMTGLMIVALLAALAIVGGAAWDLTNGSVALTIIIPGIIGGIPVLTGIIFAVRGRR